MSDNSQEVHYNRYAYEYCNTDVEPTDDDDTDEYEGKTFCVRPGKTDLDEDRVYEFRSRKKCKGSSKEFQHRFSFGPSNSAHDC